MLSESTPNPERLAQLFHETYERLAPSFGYSTRIESAVPWADVPAQNKALMIAVADAVLAAGYRPQDEVATRELRFRTPSGKGVAVAKVEGRRAYEFVRVDLVMLREMMADLGFTEEPETTEKQS